MTALVTATDLKRSYEVKQGWFRAPAQLQAVGGVSFAIETGKTERTVVVNGRGQAGEGVGRGPGQDHVRLGEAGELDGLGRAQAQGLWQADLVRSPDRIRSLSSIRLVRDCPNPENCRIFRQIR